MVKLNVVVQDLALTVYLDDGSTPDVVPPDGLTAAFAELRRLLHQPGRGTWFWRCSPARRTTSTTGCANARVCRRSPPRTELYEAPVFDRFDDQGPTGRPKVYKFAQETAQSLLSTLLWDDSMTEARERYWAR